MMKAQFASLEERIKMILKLGVIPLFVKYTSELTFLEWRGEMS